MSWAEAMMVANASVSPHIHTTAASLVRNVLAHPILVADPGLQSNAAKARMLRRKRSFALQHVGKAKDFHDSLIPASQT
jgi:hypothetical protein